MTYDLIAWPVDRAMTVAEAAAEVDGLRGAGGLGPGHDLRLDPFVAELERRYPGIRGKGPTPPPCELDVHRGHVFLGIPWGRVEELVPVVSDTAWRTGLAVFDPQRSAVGLPAPLADAPLSSEGVDRHVREARGAFSAIEEGVASAAGADDAGVRHAVSDRLRAAGYRQLSPLGFEITPDMEAEVLADPFRLPTSLQTPERKAELIGALGAPMVGDRHAALTQLAAWDPDPEVAAALRPLLASDDVFEAGQAAIGLARQADITDLPAVLDLVRRLSPADGGTTESMLLPLRAALDLAALAGPAIVDGVKTRARAWRGEPKRRRNAWEHDLDRDLDELLGP